MGANAIALADATEAGWFDGSYQFEFSTESWVAHPAEPGHSVCTLVCRTHWEIETLTGPLIEGKSYFL